MDVYAYANKAALFLSVQKELFFSETVPWEFFWCFFYGVKTSFWRRYLYQIFHCVYICDPGAQKQS